MAHLDDIALRRRCLDGDQAAWDALVRQYGDVVFAMCLRSTGKREDAQDVSQDVLLKVFAKLESYNPRRASFRTWLLQVTKRLLIDAYRRGARERQTDTLDLEGGFEPVSACVTQPETGLRRREIRDKVVAGWSSLAPEVRGALGLRLFREMEYADIADRLGIPPGTVKSRIHRGARQLAHELRALGVSAA